MPANLRLIAYATERYALEWQIQRARHRLPQARLPRPRRADEEQNRRLGDVRAPRRLAGGRLVDARVVGDDGAGGGGGRGRNLRGELAQPDNGKVLDDALLDVVKAKVVLVELLARAGEEGAGADAGGRFGARGGRRPR